MSYLDDEGYPTEDALQRIVEWDPADFDGWMRFIASLWWDADRVVRRTDGGVELHTGGWSCNESIIDAMECNLLAWVRYWVSSRRGGHYEFRREP